jgi:hypothetical protein
LLAAQHGAAITSTEVDWLAWEDPFWARATGVAHVDAEQLRRAQENDPLQVVKRIQMHAPMALVMAEPRFRGMIVRTHRPRKP